MANKSNIKKAVSKLKNRMIDWIHNASIQDLLTLNSIMKLKVSDIIIKKNKQQ